MIDYIKGSIDRLTPAFAVIDNGGIGYMLNISLTTYAALQGKTDVRLFVHEVIREDAHTLYGFFTESERQLFIQLFGVSGVGASTARIILSSIPPGELETVIATGDDRRLKAVKGIGAKTAQRIIVDLKDKIKPADDTLSLLQSAVEPQCVAYEEALAALVALEFPRAAAQKALRAIFNDNPAATTEQAIKKAFSMM